MTITTGAPERVHVLILGCGFAARLHSRVLRRCGHALSYASRDRSRSETLRRRFGGRHAFGSYADGLAESRADVALIATPTTMHRELALLALGVGKHVIVEKPAFLDVAEADDVAAAAARAGRSVFVAENYFYKPIAEHLRRTLASGDLGEVRFLTLNATKRQHLTGWRRDAALSGGGALFEGGVHWINFASNIGLEVGEVTALRAGAASGERADLSSLVVFRYQGGAVGTLAYSWEIAAPFGHVRVSKVQGTLGAVTFESNGFAHVTTGRRPSAGVLLRDPLGYGAMHADFLGALRDGRPPRFTLALARRDLQLLARCNPD